MGGPPSHLGQNPEGPARRALRVAREYVPRGNTLDDESFRQRHTLLSWVLALHLPALLIFGIVEGFGIEHSALEVLTPAIALGGARLVRNRRLAAFFVTVGLVYCSSLLVYFSGGMIEAHFHFFVLVGLIALYQDWVPFLWNVVFTVLSHGLGSALAADSMFNHHAGQSHPWTWALIHGIAVLAACIGVMVFWKNTEIEQTRSSTLAATLAAAQTKAAQRQAVSDLFVNLARRNQSLLDRQLELISELEQRKRTPEALDELFQLDHLATRIRRNAESLLVLSGDDPPRRWGRPVALGEVVRAAAAEVEDYRRVDIGVSEHLEVAGRAVADLAHLLAELIENATRFSPGHSDVRVRSYLTPGPRPAYLLSVEDTGFGMTEADMQAANDLLADPPEVDLRGRTMGFHVVSRLAQRYVLRVSLANTPGGGTTALVTLPIELVSERPPTTAPPPARQPTVPAGVHHIDRGDRLDRVERLDPDGVVRVTAHAWTAPPVSDDPPEVAVASSATATSPSSSPPSQLTADGLVRRIPGARLTPALRQRPPIPTTPPPPQEEAPSSPLSHLRAAARPPVDRYENGGHDGDRDQMRSMLSRFQASQRAGRAIAEAPVGSLVHREER